MPYATYRFNKIIAAETIRFIVTVAIVVYKGLKLVVYRMLTGNEYYDGNLLDILDNRFQRVINIPNNKLNELIYKKMKCDKNCAKCGYCKDLYTTIQNEFV